MDTTLTHAKNELADRLVEVGRRLDAATDPDMMRALLAERKRFRAALAVLRAITPITPTPRALNAPPRSRRR